MSEERAWEKRCFRCMRELSRRDETCPECGFDNSHRSNEEGFLQGAMLREQYYAGKALGRGGFGVTYVGYDFNLGRRVAIKEYYPMALARRQSGAQRIAPFSDSKEQFEQGCQRALEEGRIIARMGSVSNVVQVYNAFRENGTVYIVMEYIDGVTLAQMVRSGGRLDWDYALGLLWPIMLAMESVHQKGVIHRDISPDNIMLSRSTKDTVLLDFGAAHTYTDEKGMPGSLRQGYAPAEQYSSSAPQDERVDEYALCATMYDLVTGIPPEPADRRKYDGARLPTPRELGAEMPEAVERVLLKGMAIEREERYEGMAALRRAFEAAISESDARGEGDKSGGSRKTEPWSEASVEGKSDSKPDKASDSKPGKKLSPTPGEKAKPKSGKKGGREKRISLLAAVGAVILAAFVAWWTIGGSGSEKAPEPASGWPRMIAGDTGLSDEQLRGERGGTVPGSEIPRASIRSARFEDTLYGAMANAWDVSKAGDGSVLAWVTDAGDGLLDLAIAAEGGVALDDDARGLFANCEKLERVDFNGCVDTSGTRDFRSMFRGCAALTELDLSGFDTGSAKDLSGMFAGCAALERLDLSGFELAGGADVSDMFEGCAKLDAEDVRPGAGMNLEELLAER